jgi:hypothetical protein
MSILYSFITKIKSLFRLQKKTKLKKNLVDSTLKSSINNDFPCVGFNMSTPQEAYTHFHGNLKAVCDYGDTCNNHAIHTWDDGKRLLCRCSKCGGWVLVQKSEYHGPIDDYYTDFFPVNSPSDAMSLNEKYNGYQIELEWKGKIVLLTNGNVTGKNWT